MASKQVKIAVLGGLRAGKDTLATMLRNNLESSKVGTLAFSTGIHNIIHEYFPEAYADGKPREHLQKIGQFMRSLNPDVWINYLFNSKEYRQMDKAGYHLFITDVRQPNEVKALREHGFTIIKIVAEEQERVRRAEELGDHFDTKSLQHETERYAEECQDYDYLVVNDGTLEELDAQSQRILKEIF